MIKTYVDLDLTDQSRITTERTVKVGDIFPISLNIESGGQERDKPVKFDTLILEVFFNDQDDAIVLVDPTDRPVIGEIANKYSNTIDAFSRKPVKGPQAMTLAALGTATPLTLFGFASLEPVGVYRGRTGRAGIMNLSKPFELRPGDAPNAVAAGKATAGLRANGPGESNLIAYGIALFKGDVVPITAVKSTLKVQP